MFATEHVCLHNLTVPAAGLRDGRNAALYLDRTGRGGGTPGVNDLLFTISYSGTVQVNSGDGIGFTGPDPGGHAIARHQAGSNWDAEFQISSTTIKDWWSRKIGLAVAEQGVNAPGDNFGWATGFSYLIPDSWGEANLTGLGNPPTIYLPFLIRGS